MLGVWAAERQASFRFTQPIDPAELLAEPGPYPRRAIRLSIQKPGMVFADGLLRAMALRDISQNGACFEAETRFSLGQTLVLSLDAIPELTAWVRWRQGRRDIQQRRHLAEASDAIGYGGLDRGGIGDISGPRSGCAAFSGNVVGDRLCLFLRNIEHHDAGALARKQAADCPADLAATTGHNRNPAFEQISARHHILPFVCFDWTLRAGEPGRQASCTEDRRARPLNMACWTPA